jgi:hypothetical protein
MRQIDRRQVLKTAGVGAGVALGAGSASAADSNQTAGTGQEEPAFTFTVTGVGGTILINKNQAPTDPLSLPTKQDPDVDKNIKIEGEAFADGTWQSTRVQFPNIIVPKERLGDLPLSQDIELFIDPINRPYTGDIVREGDQKLTVSGGIQIDIPPALKSLFPDFTPITTSFNLTTGVSNQLQGSIEGLDTRSATGQVVDNQFDVDETNLDIINDALGLPAPPGTNELVIDIEVSVAPPKLPEASGPPQDLDGDGLFENVSGDGSPGVDDVQMLFDNLDSARVQENADAYNFQGGSPDRVTIFDVQAMFFELNSS